MSAKDVRHQYLCSLLIDREQRLPATFPRLSLTERTKLVPRLSETEPVELTTSEKKVADILEALDYKFRASHITSEGLRVFMVNLKGNEDFSM